MCIIVIHTTHFIVFSYAVGEREGLSPSRDYPKPWLDFLYTEGCVVLNYTYQKCFISNDFLTLF